MKLNKLKKIITYLIIFSLIFVLFDLYILRGLTSAHFLYQKDIDSKKSEFTIEKKNKELYTFTFKNKSIIPSYFVNYRNGNIFTNDIEYIFFIDNRNRIMNTIGDIKEIDLTFGCGNGLGHYSINPYEKFIKDYSYEDILNEISYPSKIFDKEGNDLLYGDKLFSDKKNFILNENSRINKKDSLDIQFYTGLYSMESYDFYPIKSNNIKIGYLDIIENYIERESKYKNN